MYDHSNQFKKGGHSSRREEVGGGFENFVANITLLSNASLKEKRKCESRKNWNLKDARITSQEYFEGREGGLRRTGLANKRRKNGSEISFKCLLSIGKNRRLSKIQGIRATPARGGGEFCYLNLGQGNHCSKAFTTAGLVLNEADLQTSLWYLRLGGKIRSAFNSQWFELGEVLKPWGTKKKNRKKRC